MKQVFKRPQSLKDVPFHFCPGCHHGTIHRLVAEALDQFHLRERTIGVAGVGCSVFVYEYFDIDVAEAPHGRAPAVATGLKRVLPDRIIFTYQGDGDLASIGMSEIVHTANRGENITVIFVNNTVYGMTGGQMAPTTLLGQQTTTSPYGRDFHQDGYPIRMAEMLATLEGMAFSARVALNTPANLQKAKKAVRQAFEMQMNDMGFTFVELLSACPTNWGLNPQEVNRADRKRADPLFPAGGLQRAEGNGPPLKNRVPGIRGAEGSSNRLSVFSLEPLNPRPLEPFFWELTDASRNHHGRGGRTGNHGDRHPPGPGRLSGKSERNLPAGLRRREAGRIGGLHGGHLFRRDRLADRRLPRILHRHEQIFPAKYAPRIKPGGFLLLNSSLIDPREVPRQDLDVLAVPSLELAKSLGNDRLANMVVIGAFVAKTRVVSLDSLISALSRVFDEKYHHLLPANAEAIRKGAACAPPGVS